jgi:dimethylaniline monooxygenase (N-oxide forming)
MPTLPNKQAFSGAIIHQENFGSLNIVYSPDIQDITVLGGGKSSGDMVYAAAKAGKTVSWVLKKTNTTSPGFFLSPRGVGPYKNAFEIGITRFAALFSPSFFNGGGWFAKLLHSTKWGVKMIKRFLGCD